MRLNPGMTQRARQAVQAFHDYANDRSGGTGNLFQQFCQERPFETQILIEMYDATHPGLNHLSARRLTRTEIKVRVAFEDAWEIDRASLSRTRWARRHGFLFNAVIPVLIRPTLPSPTHPVAVLSTTRRAEKGAVT